jgi:uncharacterized membrane protein YfcA
MEIFWICLTTFIVSGLTLFSGFGLGTILMPVVAIFLPVPIAIAITAVVHFMNKIFKLLLLWRHVDMRVLVVFGIPALLAAIPGALLLDYISELNPLATYMLLGNEHSIAPVKLVAGLLLIFFAVAEQVPFLRNNTLRRFGLPVGGLLSGFFGGLTGQQGAFRSAFLVQDNLSEKAFIATNAAIAALVDAFQFYSVRSAYAAGAISHRVFFLWRFPGRDVSRKDYHPFYSTTGRSNDVRIRYPAVRGIDLITERTVRFRHVL